MLEKDLSPYAGLFTDYTELRVQANRTLRIAMVHGSLVRNSRSGASGVSARVYRAGSWGFASNPELERDAVEAVIRSATHNARFLDGRLNKGSPPLPGRPARADHDFGTRRTRLGQAGLVEFVRRVDAHVEKTYPELKSRTVSLGCLDMEKSLLTSDGAAAYSMVPRSNIAIVLTVERDGIPFELYDVHGGLGQFEDVFDDPEDLFEGIEEQHGHLMRKAEGVYPDPGIKECVLDAELAGILAHEALGHTTEADIILGGSVAPKYLGREAASPLITLVDFAHTALDKTCPVPVYVDDEGTGAEDAVIIDRGILRSYMHNRETARRFGHAPTGNARAYRFADEPIIRMRNTAIVPGESRMEEMIGSIDDGYYLVKPSNGQADSTGEFMFGVPLGYQIKAGRLGRALRDTTISGLAFDVLKSVTMVSSDMHWSNSGMCGKKQAVPVGLGGPAVKCRVNIGGR